MIIQIMNRRRRSAVPAAETKRSRADPATRPSRGHRASARQGERICRLTQAARVLDQGHGVELLRETGSIDLSPLAGEVLGWVRSG
jgi:hypothetical protein